VAVGCILGSTFTGGVDEIEAIDAMLQEIKKEKGWDIPIHVDAASGGFVVPFLQPDHKWDFRLEHVRSINVSNHKFGLVYLDLGSVIFKSKEVVPSELKFDISYLGGHMTNYSLNFSRTTSPILLQYYNFLRLGRDGYTKIMKNVMKIAAYTEKKLVASGKFDPISDTKFVPVVAVKLKEDSKTNVYDLTRALRQWGWNVPAYALPKNAQSTHLFRVVVKENFSRDMADSFINNVHSALEQLESHAPTARGPSEATADKTVARHFRAPHLQHHSLSPSRAKKQVGVHPVC